MKLLLCLAVLLAAVFAGQEHCDPSYDCQFKSPDGQHFFDFSHLCSPTDYELTDDLQPYPHTYFANICGMAAHPCRPTWQQMHTFGVAVQTWESTVPAGLDCFNVDGSPAHCTKACEVLGLDLPEWSFIDETNPATGGVKATYTRVDAEGDLHRCHYMGEFQPRTVTYEFQCDKYADPVIPVIAKQHNACDYTLIFKTKHACGNDPTPSSGSNPFVTVLIVVVVLAALGYAAIVLFEYSQTQTWNYKAPVDLAKNLMTPRGVSGSKATTSVSYASIGETVEAVPKSEGEETKKTFSDL